MSETINKASVCEILADIYPTDGEKVVAVKEIDKVYEAILRLLFTQPEIIHCLDCKNWDKTWTTNEPRWSDNEVVNFLKTRPSAQAEQKWIPCSERSPKKYGWYQVTLKDGRVNRLYYDYKSDRWIDNVRKHMFELYDIYSKSTHKRITEEKEDVYWDDWVIAWMPLPESYREEGEQNGKN